MQTDFLNVCNTEISRRYPASPHYSFLHLAGTVVMGEDPGLLAKILGFQSRLCRKWVSAKKRAMVFDYLLSLKDLENQSARTNGKRRGAVYKGLVESNNSKRMQTADYFTQMMPSSRRKSFLFPFSSPIFLSSSTFLPFIPQLLLSFFPPLFYHAIQITEQEFTKHLLVPEVWELPSILRPELEGYLPWVLGL